MSFWIINKTIGGIVRLEDNTASYGGERAQRSQCMRCIKQSRDLLSARVPCCVVVPVWGYSNGVSDKLWRDSLGPHNMQYMLHS